MDGDQRYWDGKGDHVLRMLPPTIEKISFGDPKIHYYGPGIWEHDTGILLAHLPNLKELRLHSCPSLKSIWPYNITTSGTSLIQLTKLTRLEIEYSGFLRIEDVLHLVKSDSLKSFKYSGFFTNERDKTVRKEFLFRIVEQNPNLESVVLYPFVFDQGRVQPSTLEGQRRAVEEEVKRINPNVKFLELKTSVWGN